MEETTLLDNVIQYALLATIALSPWMFGCTDAIGEFFLTLGLSTVILIGCAQWLSGRPIQWRGGRAGYILVGGICVLAVSAASHLLPMPSSLRTLLSPAADSWMANSLSLDRGDTGQAWRVETSVAMYRGGSLLVMLRAAMLAGVAVVVGTMPNPKQLLRRLSVLSAVLGTALALFGLAQHYGSHDGLLYWSIPVDGGLGFGPFVNRNHYPFFLNLTLGLTLGLLVERFKGFGGAWGRMIFNDASFPWLIAAVGIMVSSLFVCVSRGGVLSGFLAFCIVGVVGFQVAQAGRSVLLTVMIAIPVVALLLWVGFDIESSRLNMLAQSDRYTSDGRWYLWKAAVQSVPEFPWLGSGGETYQFWETIHQSGDVSWDSSEGASLRADNEFLDVLNEYGIVGLLGLCMIAVSACIQSVRSSRLGGLGMGASMGVLAVFLHSFVDFGLRVPATGVFALVVGMLVCCHTTSEANGRPFARSRRGGPKRSADTRSADTRSTERRATHEGRQWSQRVTSVSVALVLIACTLTTVAVRKRYYQAEKARLDAREDLIDLAYDDAMLEMQHATSLTPQDAIMRMEAVRVAECVLDRSRDERQRDVATQLILGHSSVLLSQCPLDWQAYAWIAQHDSRLEPEQQLQFLRKSRSLHPGQPDLAFLAGQLELASSTLDRALPHWRDSLASSLNHLPEICEAVTGKISAEQWTSALLPSDPVVTFAAAKLMEVPLKNTILNHTLELLKSSEAIPRKPSPGQWQALRAETLAELGRLEEAIAIMRRGLNEGPDNIEWRLKMASWCIEQQRLDEAVREVRIVLTLDRENRLAEQLQQQISRLKAKAVNAK